MKQMADSKQDSPQENLASKTEELISQAVKKFNLPEQELREIAQNHSPDALRGTLRQMLRGQLTGEMNMDCVRQVLPHWEAFV